MPLRAKSALLLGLGLVWVVPAPADTIYLKNGMSIKVTRAVENGAQIEYWMGGTKYAMSKDAVERIEHGNGPPRRYPTGVPAIQDLTRRDSSPTTANRDKLPLPVPHGPRPLDPYWAALRTRIMQGDRVNEIKLAEIELDHDSRTTSNAYLLAGVTELQAGNPAQAGTYFEHALQATPEQAQLLQWHALALSNQGRYAEAVGELEKAVALQPDSAPLLQMLGFARYNADRTADAIAAWKRATELAPDPAIERLLRKAQREMEVEESARRKESRHFTLRYQGDAPSPEFQQQILATMEAHYSDLARQLNYQPGENIIVILYTQKQFVDITEAPSWAGALNDGKLRIPVRGLSTVNRELERILKHELTHSFLRSLTDGRCPTWLNEGLAQLLEPRTTGAFASHLAPLFQQRKEIPYAVLEQPFVRFSDIQAQVAYAESLSATEYLRDRYGMGEVVRLLRNIGSGMEPELALRQGTGMDYSALQQRVGEYLAKAGGD